MCSVGQIVAHIIYVKEKLIALHMEKCLQLLTSMLKEMY